MSRLAPGDQHAEWETPRRQDLDSELLMARNLVDSRFVFHSFGRNPSISTIAEDIWTNGGVYPWPTGSEPIRIQESGSVQDHATGSGARSIFVEGLDDNFNIIGETLITSGALASAPTSQSFRRIYRASVIEAGEYTGANSGTIVIEGTGSATVLGSIDQYAGQTQMTMYTIPAGKVGYLTALAVNVDGAQSSDLKMFQRRAADETSSFASRRLIMALDGLSTTYNRDIKSYIRFPEKTDIWWNAVTAQSTTAVSVNFDLIVVDAISRET